jgi:hypothetical protein
LEKFAEFNMEICYSPGSTNNVADALSRKPNSNDTSTLQTLNVSSIDLPDQIKKEIQKGLVSDSYFGEVINALQNTDQTITNYNSKIRRFFERWIAISK